MAGEAVIEEPPATFVPGGTQSMFDDAARQSLQQAMDERAAAKADSPVPDPNATPKPPDKPAAKAPDKSASKLDPPKPPAKTDAPTDYPKSAKLWEEWKAKERAEWETKLAEVQKQIKPVNTKELDELRKGRDELAKQLQMVAIERDPKFNREYESASKTILDMAKVTAGAAKADVVEKLLKMNPSEARDAAVEVAMENMPTYKQTQLAYALAEMDKLRGFKAAKIQESLANWDSLQTEAQSRQQAEQEKLKGVFEKHLAEFSGEKGLPILKERDGDTEWNAKVQDTISLAREIFGGNLDPDGLSKAAIWAASAPMLLADAGAKATRIAELEKEIAELKGLGPGASGGGGAEKKDETDDIPAGLGYGASIAAAVRKAGLM